MNLSRIKNTGRGLESVVIASQSGVVRLEQLPQHGARFIGKDRAIRQHQPCDFIGVFIGNGRGLYFDAKSDGRKTSFGIGHADHVHAHQIAFLERMGSCGAVAGLIVESTVSGEIYWLDHRYILPHVKSLRWDHPAMVRVAEKGRLIDFRRVLEASGAADRDERTKP